MPSSRSITRISTNDQTNAAVAARHFGQPVVLKLLSRSVTHKSEAGGVAVGVEPQDVEARIGAMAAAVHGATGERPRAWLVQEHVHGGVEMILGLHRDPLGTAVLLGMGGVTAELVDDTVLRLLPEGGAAPGGGQPGTQAPLTRGEALAMARLNSSVGSDPIADDACRNSCRSWSPRVGSNTLSVRSRETMALSMASRLRRVSCAMSLRSQTLKTEQNTASSARVRPYSN